MNNRDCAEKLRGNARPDSSVKKLTPERVREIRSLYASGLYSQQQLAQKFHVAQMTISKIIRRETWAYLDD